MGKKLSLLLLLFMVTCYGHAQESFFTGFNGSTIGDRDDITPVGWSITSSGSTPNIRVYQTASPSLKMSTVLNSLITSRYDYISSLTFYASAPASTPTTIEIYYSIDKKETWNLVTTESEFKDCEKKKMELRTIDVSKLRGLKGVQLKFRLSAGIISIDDITIKYGKAINVTTNLATILDGGVDNFYYEIGLPLQGICADGGYLYAKTENGFCSHISKNTNTPADPAYEDKESDFDQSDWIALKIANPENYVNKTIEAGLIGKYLGTELTPTLEVVGEAKTAATTTIPYEKNRYEVRNIKGESKNNPTDHKVFFVKSKINEVATFVGRIYKNATTSVYTLNTEDGDIELDNSNNQSLKISTQGDKVYQEFAGVLRADATQQPLVKVLEASKVLTGVENIGNDNAQSAIVIGGNNSINITCNEGASVMICDITGKIISNISVADSNVSVEIPAGIYIVKVDNKVTKVIVK